MMWFPLVRVKSLTQELLERSFVAIPMAEIAPDYVHPEVKVTLEEIALQFNPATEAIIRRDDVELFGAR